MELVGGSNMICRRFRGNRGKQGKTGRLSDEGGELSLHINFGKGGGANSHINFVEAGSGLAVGSRQHVGRGNVMGVVGCFCRLVFRDLHGMGIGSIFLWAWTLLGVF